MTRAEALASKLVGSTELPARITGCVVTLTHTADAVSRGRPDRVAAEAAQTLDIVMPLFAAGFCAADLGQMANGQGITGVVDATPTGLTLTIENAAHGPRLVYLLLRLIEAHSQTPAGAYERLLYMLDGDEEEARAVFNPLSLAADVATISLSVTGSGVTTPLDVAIPPPHAALDPVARAIPIDVERLIFAPSRTGGFTTATEHGFLTLNDLGCLHPFDAHTGSPEMFVHDRNFIVDEWQGATLFLAEYLAVVTGGDLSGPTIQTEGEGL